MAAFFDTTIFSSTCSLQKPDLHIYNLAIEQLGIKPEECIFVDDNVANLTAAVKAGMSAIYYKNNMENEDPYAAKQNEALKKDDDWQGTVITSLPEVLDVLEE